MQQKLFSSMRPVLDLLNQPAFLLEKGAVTYYNPAARPFMQSGSFTSSLSKLGICEGETIHTTLNLLGKDYPATFSIQNGVVLCLLGTAAPEISIPQSLLDTISGQIRRYLSELFLASRRVLPELPLEEDPQLSQNASVIYRNLYRLLRLAGQLSDGSRMLHDQLRLQRTPVELMGFFQKFADSATDLLRYAQLHLNYTGLKKPVTCQIDEIRVERAMWNMVANAAAHLPPDGSMNLTVRIEEPFVMIQLEDFGSGVDEAVRAEVFERYANKTGLGEPQSGLGFGMTIVQRVSMLHGGTAVLLAKPDGGATVTMSLRLSRPNGTVVREPQMKLAELGSINRGLVELADILPLEAYNVLDIDG